MVRLPHRRVAAVLAGGTLLLIILGCMSIAIGNRGPDSEVAADGSFVQQGEANVPAGSEQDVYYPVPYAHPPNLELTDTFNHCVILEQHVDHFRLRNKDGCFSHTACWRARGVRCPAPACGPTPEPPPVAPVPVPAR